MSMLNEIIDELPSFYPAIIDSAKLHYKNQQYAHARGLAQHACSITEYKNRDALQLYILTAFSANCSKQEQILINLQNLLSLSSDPERISAELCFESAHLFAGISDDANTDILKISLEFVSLAIQVDPTNLLYRLEKANILLRLHNFKDAIKNYQSILKTNEDCVEALLGCLQCEISSGNIRDACDQLEFISIATDDLISK